ncbi:ABC transporter permease [Candidatus Riflebacteria bacterium]
MNFRRIRAVTRKEFIHLSRDMLSVYLAIAIPIMLLTIFGYALTLDVDRVPLVVWDQSRTVTSREYVSFYSGTPYFSLIKYCDNYRQLEWEIDRGNALIAMVIPTDFAKKIQAGKSSPVQLLVDGSDPNTANIAMGYATLINIFYGPRVFLGIGPYRGNAFKNAIDARPRVWFNAELISRNYIFPGLIAMVMMSVAAMLTSLTIAREWETGTMEQLISTPVGGMELIIGKVIPYLLLGLLDMLLAVLMGSLLFEVPLRGNPALIFITSSIFLIGAMGLGILISIVTKSQLVASQIAMVSTFLPSFLLSGLIFAIPNMPEPIQLITYLVPARYFIVLLRGIYLKGVGIEILYFEMVLLCIFGLLVFLLARKKFVKKLV